MGKEKFKCMRRMSYPMENDKEKRLSNQEMII